MDIINLTNRKEKTHNAVDLFVVAYGEQTYYETYLASHPEPIKSSTYKIVMQNSEPIKLYFDTEQHKNMIAKRKAAKDSFFFVTPEITITPPEKDHQVIPEITLDDLRALRRNKVEEEKYCEKILRALHRKDYPYTEQALHCKNYDEHGRHCLKGPCKTLNMEDTESVGGNCTDAESETVDFPFWKSGIDPRFKFQKMIHTGNDSGIDSGIESATESDGGLAEVDTKADVVTEADVDTEADFDTEAEVDTKAEVDTEAEVDTKAEVDTEAVDAGYCTDEEKNLKRKDLYVKIYEDDESLVNVEKVIGIGEDIERVYGEKLVINFNDQDGNFIEGKYEKGKYEDGKYIKGTFSDEKKQKKKRMSGFMSFMKKNKFNLKRNSI